MIIVGVKTPFEEKKKRKRKKNLVDTIRRPLVFLFLFERLL